MRILALSGSQAEGTQFSRNNHSGSNRGIIVAGPWNTSMLAGHYFEAVIVLDGFDRQFLYELDQKHTEERANYFGRFENPPQHVKLHESYRALMAYDMAVRMAIKDSVPVPWLRMNCREYIDWEAIRNTRLNRR